MKLDIGKFTFKKVGKKVDSTLQSVNRMLRHKILECFTKIYFLNHRN